ncbi:MAG: hypothetical protein U9R15_19645 [Chloroflexota bacterium]|nr:hypothetical protein [Chloroflexota bacterium]
MAKVVVKGFFGVKQTFNVASSAIGGDPYNSNQAPTGTWSAGNLFGISTASDGIDAYVSLNSVSGSNVMGVAMENSADALTAVAGMSQPSGSKVTLLHGHSEFEITGSQYEVYEPEVESASLMDTLYASPNGKFASFNADVAPAAIGFITKVPAAGNSYTLGVVLFG